MAELATPFLCDTCGELHPALPLSYSVKAPLTVMQISLPERLRRVVINLDQCVIDDHLFFLRGRIVVPIQDHREPFIWGVWAQVTLKDFFTTNQNWNTAGREHDAVFRGRLDTDLSLFGSTTDLAVDVHTQIVGRRPHFNIVDTRHPLGREQRNGISLARVKQIAAKLLHGHHTTSIGESRGASAAKA